MNSYNKTHFRCYYSMYIQMYSITVYNIVKMYVSGPITKVLNTQTGTRFVFFLNRNKNSNNI